VSQHQVLPVISVVIPVYNRRVIMAKTLGYLSQQTLDPTRFEVVVVDDASTDGTGEMIKSLKPPLCFIASTAPRRGACRARQQPSTLCGYPPARSGRPPSQ
jgi:glycosyltransferase involved in cell wall biosynthesis